MCAASARPKARLLAPDADTLQAHSDYSRQSLFAPKHCGRGMILPSDRGAAYNRFDP